MKKNRFAFKIKMRCKIAFFLSGVFLFFVLALVLFIFESSYLETVNNAKKMYGTYTFLTEEVNAEDEKIIEQNLDIKDVSYISSEAKFIDECEYVNYYIESGDMNLLGIQLLAGNFPTSEDEILIDVEYMNRMNLDDNIISKQIEYNNHKYVVTGMIKRKSVFEGTVDKYVFVFKNSGQEKNYTYYSMLDYRYLDKDMEKISSVTNIDIYPNWGVFLNLGFADGIGIYRQTENVYRYIYMIFVMGLLIINYNLVKYCVFQQYDTFLICNLIGVTREKTICAFLKKIYFYILLGGILGGCSACLCAYGIHMKLYKNIELFLEVLQNFDYIRYVLGILLCLLALTICLSPIIMKLLRLSPNELLRSSKEGFSEKKINKYKKYLFSNGKFFTFRFAKHNLKNEVVMHIFATISIAIATCLIVACGYYIRINVRKNIVNKDYSYEIQLYEFFFDSAEQREIENLYYDNLGFDDNIILYPRNEAVFHVYIDKEKLNSKFLEYIYQDSEQRISGMMGEKLKLNAVVLGYDETERKQLVEMNSSLDIETLNNEEAIVVTTVDTDLYASNSFSLNFSKGDYLKMDLKDGEKKRIDVVGTVSKLPIEASNGKYNIIIIVSEEYYRELTKENFPQYVYIYDENLNTHNQVALERLQRNQSIVFKYPKNDYIYQEKLNVILDLFTYAIAGLLIILSISILASNMLLRISIRINEYAMMKVVGISNVKIWKIFVYESGIIQIEAQLIAMFVSYFVTKRMLILRYPIYGTYIYSYPMSLILISIIISLATWLALICLVGYCVKIIDAQKITRGIN